jgi:hypothetical protein
MNNSEFTLPLCFLPQEMQGNYLQRVIRFYENQGRERIEARTREIEAQHLIRFKSLIWDEALGLTNISFSSGGLDLRTEGIYRYIFHNVYLESDYGKAAFEVAREYVNTLKN